MRTKSYAVTNDTLTRTLEYFSSLFEAQNHCREKARKDNQTRIIFEVTEDWDTKGRPRPSYKKRRTLRIVQMWVPPNKSDHTSLWERGQR